MTTIGIRDVLGDMLGSASRVDADSYATALRQEDETPDDYRARMELVNKLPGTVRREIEDKN